MPRRSFTDENGKRHFVRAATTEELIIKVYEKKKALEAGTEIVSPNTTVKAWMDKWMVKYKQPAVGAAWYAEMKRIVDKRIDPVIGSIPLKKIRQVNIQAVLVEAAGLSDSYLKKIYNVLNESFGKAVDNQLMLNNPVKGVEIPKGKKKEQRRALTDYERTQIVKLSEMHRAGLFLMLMLYCGLRPGEVAALRWKNIDLKRRTIKIDSALKKDGTVGEPKSDAGVRTIPIPIELLTMLESHKKEPFSLVCAQKSGDMHSRTSIRQMWGSFVYRLNIQMGCKTFKGGLIPPERVAKDLVPYCLRHTYCTDLQAAGVPMNVARELMGHSDIATTSKIYTHKSDEPIENALAALDALNLQRATKRATQASTAVK